MTNHLTHEMCQRKCGRVKGALKKDTFYLFVSPRAQLIGARQKKLYCRRKIFLSGN